MGYQTTCERQSLKVLDDFLPNGKSQTWTFGLDPAQKARKAPNGNTKSVFNIFIWGFYGNLEIFKSMMKCKLKVGKNWTIPFQSESYLIREREVFKDSAGFQKPRVAGSDCFVFDSGKGAARNSILKQEFFRSANKSIQHITSIPPTKINTVNNSANNLPFFAF